MLISKSSPRSISEIAKLKVRVSEVLNQSYSSIVRSPPQGILKRQNPLVLGLGLDVCLCRGAHLLSGLVPGSVGSVMTGQGVTQWTLEHSGGTQVSLGGLRSG